MAGRKTQSHDEVETAAMTDARRKRGRHYAARLDRGNLERAAQYARKAADGLGVVLAAMVLKPDEADLEEWADASDGLREAKAALGDALTELGE